MSKHTLTIQQLPVGDANNPTHDTICDGENVIATVWDKSYTAKLAAAHDMLEVCQMMVEAMFHAPHPEFMNRCAQAADAARAALAKAQPTSQA